MPRKAHPSRAAVRKSLLRGLAEIVRHDADRGAGYADDLYEPFGEADHARWRERVKKEAERIAQALEAQADRIRVTDEELAAMRAAATYE